MKKFKLTHLIGMVLLFWSASPAVQAVQPDYKYGDLRVTDQNAHREVITELCSKRTRLICQIKPKYPCFHLGQGYFHG